jgi:hypothetical protein
VAAGDSAASEAERARQAAARLRRKAAYADHVAENYAKGSDGERTVAEALQPLEAEGWRIVHDLVDPEGGNIDHLAIGPPGIAVVDAKNWSSAVSVTTDRRLVTGGKDDRSSELDRLAKRVDLVRRRVAADGMHVAVRGYLVLCGDRDRERPSEDLGDLRVVGVDRVADRLRRARGDLGGGDVGAIADTLSARLVDLSTLPPPPATPSQGSAAEIPAATPLAGLEAPSPIFDRAHRIYFLRPWRRAGHNRLYLRDQSGTSLGWTDVNTGAQSIDCSGVDAQFAAALLAAADPTGVKLAPGELPKLATQLWGGRLLSRIARLHMSVLVGQEWRNYGKHRLYGTLIDPEVSTYHLGYIDLKAETLHPSGTGAIGKDRGSAERYLGFLWHRLPPAPPAKQKG